MPPAQVSNISILGAKFVYRTNFEGRVEGYNEDGSREFNVQIPDNILQQVVNDGWNVKYTKPRKSATPEEIESFVSVPYLEVSVGFKYRPPTIVIIQDGKESVITEQSVDLLDTLVFENIDMVIRGRVWESSFGTGVRPYLQTFYGTVEMDDVQRKYARMRNGE